ncbi:MAG: RNA methyltransferase [Candidatus Aminicenantes bacterium]|nr:RNA methyltransferase [Candidatus Aminicenantes bacterium]
MKKSEVMIYRITSRSNPKVKELLKEKDNYFIFEGEKLVRDILQRDMKISKLIINNREEGKLNISGKSIHEIWYVHEQVLRKISSLKESADFLAVLKIKKRKINLNKARIVIGIHDVQDPGNVGTIFRCAAAFGIDSIALTGASVNPNNSRFLRAAQTSFLEVDFQEFEDVETLIKKAKAKNYHIYLTSAGFPGEENPVPMDEVHFPCVIIFGNEGQGLKEALFTRFPMLRIPQNKDVESLNVGVSACIIMYAITKS